MSLRVLGIASSPRSGGNSTLLLEEALRGARDTGASIETLTLAPTRIAGCRECNHCYGTGQCRFTNDDYPAVQEMLLAADRIVLATPVFFMNVPAQLKAPMDRCQCLWARKYVLRHPLFDQSRDRRALSIVLGGSSSRKMFDSVRRTLQYFYDVLDVVPVSALHVNRVDGQGDIWNHPPVLEEAFRLGRALAERGAPKPDRMEILEYFDLPPAGPEGEHRGKDA